MTGLVFSRLTVLGFAGEGKWFCRCICGEIRVVIGQHLKNGHSRSCGCWRAEAMGRVSRTHGQSFSLEYKSYNSAKDRCVNPRNRGYERYGGRGIEFRFSSFEQFIDHIGKRPHPASSIERIDVDGHYEPGNVRWASPKEQARNRSSNRFVTINGESKTIAEWAEGAGLDRATFRYRLNAGWCQECLFSAEVKTCPHR